MAATLAGAAATERSIDTARAAEAVFARPDATNEAIASAEDQLRSLLQEAKDPAIRGQAALALAKAALLTHNDLAAAIPLFERARSLLPPSGRAWTEATFGLATAMQHRLPVSPASIERASRLFEEVLAADSASLLAAQAHMSLGRIREVLDYTGDVQQHEQARERYSTVFTTWSEDEVAHEAAFRFGSTFVQEAYYPPETRRLDWEWRIDRMLTGVRFLKEWVVERPEGALASGIWEYIGNTYLLLPEEEEWRRLALRAYLQSTGDRNLIDTGEAIPVKRNMDRVNPGYLYLRIAGLAHQQGLREVAFEYYGRLISEVPDYAYGPEAALQLTANLGYTRDEVSALLRRQYQAMDYSEVEIERLLSDFEFLEPPTGMSVPEP